MNLSVKQMLQDKGIDISDDILTEVETRWKNVSEMKKSLDKHPVSDIAIALRNTPRGDKV